MKTKIIFVDDEDMILKSLKREFSDFCNSLNMEIITFNSVSDALSYLSTNHFDISIVVSDMRMPEMKGSHFLQEVHTHYPSIKLLLLTAYSDIEDIQEAVKASLMRLIIKPWDHEELKASIKDAHKCYTLERENLELKKELSLNLKIAGDFQRTLLGKPNILISNTDIDYRYIPVPWLKCGGDFYDFISLKDNIDIIMLGDVSGHGIKPAFVTSMLKVLTSINNPKIYSGEMGPGEILTSINKGLYTSLGEIRDIITTFSIVLIDGKNKKLTFTGAGHSPVYIIRDNELINIKTDCPAMGLIHEYNYNEIEYDLQTNDLLIMYTDGLVESENTQSTMDTDKIESNLLGLDLDKRPVESIINHFRKLQKDETFADDVTLITARIH